MADRDGVSRGEWAVLAASYCRAIIDLQQHEITSEEAILECDAVVLPDPVELAAHMDDLCPVGVVETPAGIALWGISPESNGNFTLNCVYRLSDGGIGYVVHAGRQGPSRLSLAGRLMAAEILASPPPPDSEREFPDGLAHFGVVRSLSEDMSPEPEGRSSDFVIAGCIRLANDHDIRFFDTPASWRASLAGEMAARLAQAASPFVERLDPEAIRLVNAFCPANVPLWRGRIVSDSFWRGIDSTFSPGAPLRRAIVKFPLLSVVGQFEFATNCRTQ